MQGLGLIFGMKALVKVLRKVCLCVLSVVLGFPQSLVEESVVQELGFLLQRYTLPKMMFLSVLRLKW